MFRKSSESMLFEHSRRFLVYPPQKMLNRRIIKLEYNQTAKMCVWKSPRVLGVQLYPILSLFFFQLIILYLGHQCVIRLDLGGSCPVIFAIVFCCKSSVFFFFALTASCDGQCFTISYLIMLELLLCHLLFIWMIVILLRSLLRKAVMFAYVFDFFF